MDLTKLWESLVMNFPVAALALYLFYREMQHTRKREIANTVEREQMLKQHTEEREQMLKQQIARERQVADKSMHREDHLLTALNSNTAALVALKAALKENGYKAKKAA